MAAKRETKTYGVFLHSSGEHGGYVVRTMHDGSAASPYLHVRPVHTYRASQAHLALGMAEKLNGDGVGAVS